MRSLMLCFGLSLCVGCGAGDDNAGETVTAVPSCTDGERNGNETGVDCGADCAPCDVGVECVNPGDCSTGVCTDAICAAAVCDDGVTNGAESDRDCGGSCAPCAADAACSMGSDCESGVCTEMTCAAPDCDDGVLNGLETDADCGGPCSLCEDGRACLEAVDCMSGLCVDRVCAENPRARYPDGPFGFAVDDIIEDVSLVAGDESDFTLSALRLDAGKRLLLVFNTAAWCGRCAADMPDLIALQEAFGDSGLAVMVSIFQDRSREPPTGRDAAQYGRQHDLSFPVVADPMELMLRYFADVGLPMVMLVDLETMQLRYAERGWNADSMRALIMSNL